MTEEKKENGNVTLGGEVVRVDTPEDIISLAQRRVDVVDKLIGLSLKRTSFRDWMNVEGQPYLGHSGAEKVARLFGIKLRNIKTEKEWSEDSKGRFYIYRTIGTAELPGGYDSIEALGTCSQRDKFFAWANSKWRDTVDIDETNIMKSSYSNFVVNAITHLLGLRNLTWDDLKGAGIETDKVQKIEYQEGAKKGETMLSADSQKKREEIWKICWNLGNGDEAMARTFLKQITFFKSKDGKEVSADDIKRLTTDKWIDMTLRNAKEAWKKAYPNEPQPTTAGEEK